MVLWCSLLVSLGHAQEAPQQHHAADVEALPPLDRGLVDGVELPVVGGSQVARGDWDQVGLLLSNGSLCTATLIGPKVVLTAAHCVGDNPRGVLFASKDYQSREGIYVDDIDRIVHHAGAGYDIALIFFENQVEGVEPMPLAVDCVVRDRLEDGRNAWMVGFGATRADGGGFNSQLNEARTTIVDHDCSGTFHDGTFMGCEPSVSPGGEVAGFTDDAHVCYGDSGGPLILRTQDGPFVVGVASRLFAGSPYNAPCSDGSIWVRPDAVFDWIWDQKDGRKLALPTCNEAPTVEVPDLFTEQEVPVTVQAIGDDPDGDVADFEWEIAQQPEHGEVAISETGEITYTPALGYFGEDAFTVRATDRGFPRWERTGKPLSVEVDVPVLVVERGCAGCSGLGGGAGLGLLGLMVPLAMVRRRRR